MANSKERKNPKKSLKRTIKKSYSETYGQSLRYGKTSAIDSVAARKRRQKREEAKRKQAEKEKKAKAKNINMTKLFFLKYFNTPYFFIFIIFKNHLMIFPIKNICYYMIRPS